MQLVVQKASVEGAGQLLRVLRLNSNIPHFTTLLEVMSDIHTCSRCNSILQYCHPITEYQKSFELPVSSLLEGSSGPNPCNFFKTLIEKCRWPQGYFDNNPNSRVAILFDDNIDSSYVLSVASLPRPPPPRPGTRNFRSAASNYGELLAWECQVVTGAGTVF